MRFADTKFSKRGVEVETSQKPLAIRFASVMLAAVLTASFLPVAAFADEGEAADVPAGNESVEQPADSGQPEATEPQDPVDQPEATEPQDTVDQPASEPQDASSAAADESKNQGAEDKQDKDENMSAFAISGASELKYGNTVTFRDSTSRTQYNWSYDSIDGGAVQIVSNGSTANVTGTKAGKVRLKVSGRWGVAETTFDLTITKRDLIMTSDSAEKTYDGYPLTNAGILITGDGLAQGDEITCFTGGSQTDAGTSKNSFEVHFDAGSSDNYNIIKNEGDLVVHKRAMTLKSADLEKEFDGTPLANGDAAVTGEDFVRSQGVTYTFTGSQKVAGSSDNSFTYEAKDGTNLNNYDISTEFGKLTVTNRSAKYEITLTPNSKAETYDGTEKSVSGFETLDFTINDLEFTVSGVTASAKGTDAGEYPVEVTGQAVVTDEDGADVTDQFTVNVADSKLIIGKRPVKLISGSDTKEYDGKPLTNDEVTVEGDGWADGEGATYEFTGKQTVVGFSPNTFSYTLDEGTKDENYSIEVNEGTLTVTSRDAKYEITVKGNSDVVTYDGAEHSVSGFETLEFEVDGSTYTVEGLTAEAKGVEAGTYTAGIVGAPVVKDAEGNDVSSEFAVKGENGCLAIAKRQVTVTGEGFDGDQPYTGDEYSKTGCTFSNMVDGQEASITYALRGTGIGTYEGVFGDDFKVMADGRDVTSNYELVEKTPGTLTIVKGDSDTPVDPDKSSSDDSSKAGAGKTATKAADAKKATDAKAASKSAKTGDSIALYVMGICGVAIAAGAVAFVVRRKLGSGK